MSGVERVCLCVCLFLAVVTVRFLEVQCSYTRDRSSNHVAGFFTEQNLAAHWSHPSSPTMTQSLVSAPCLVARQLQQLPRPLLCCY